MKAFLRGLSASLLVTAGWAFAATVHAEEVKSDELATVETAKGVMVRVPVDASGHELEQQAEMRLHGGAAVTNADDLLRAWNESVPVVNGTDDGIAIERRGWGGRGWGGRGWGWGGRGWGGRGWGYGRRFFGWPFFFGPYGYYRYGTPYYYGDDCDDDDDCKTSSNYYYYPSLGFKAYQ